MGRTRTRIGVGDRPPPPPDLVGTTVLDQYVVEAELGAGAMGTVYRAHHAKLARHVALKVMHPHLVFEPALLERFYREAKAAARLGHPNVAAVLDVGETDDGKHVMVMELVDGTSLGDILDRAIETHEAPPRAWILDIVAQLLRGLDHAHAMGLVHRDLKPDNVLIEANADGSVARIVDFGIAAVSRPNEDLTEPLDRLTGTGVIIGTPLYMAPEQARCEPIDHRADLYALGIMLYELLSGVSPFAGTAMEVAVAKMDKDPPPIRVRAPGVAIDRPLDAFLAKLIARTPDQRFASAHAALEAIELYRRDPIAAGLALGVTDVARALATISLSR